MTFIMIFLEVLCCQHMFIRVEDVKEPLKLNILFILKQSSYN